MKMQRIDWRSARAVACVAFTLAIAAAAGATTIERMSLEKMAVAAPVIVRARCVGNSVVRDAGEIWTFTSFDVEETWRGTPPPRITVRLLGGKMGDITSHVSGVPKFRPGEDTVLFLQTTPRGDFSVVSWEQGTFRIHCDAADARAFVTQDTASFATFDPTTRRFRAAGIRNMSLGQFRARVEAALQTAGAMQQ
ncbi:MAG: hypothetical protein ACRD4R_12140 [Candidatus Acidiferrales bacterium]